MNPLIPEDRKKILIANLRSIAAELERGTSELVFTDSHGILTPTGDTDTWMVVVHCRDRKPNPDVIAIAEVLQETRALLAAMMGPVNVYTARTFDDRRPLGDSRDQIRTFVEKHLPKPP